MRKNITIFITGLLIGMMIAATLRIAFHCMHIFVKESDENIK